MDKTFIIIFSVALLITSVADYIFGSFITITGLVVFIALIILDKDS